MAGEAEMIDPDDLDDDDIEAARFMAGEALSALHHWEHNADVKTREEWFLMGFRYGAEWAMALDEQELDA